jgi:pilus assembly protein CpaC
MPAPPELPILGDSGTEERAGSADLFPIPVTPPKPAEAKSFIQSLKGNDAAFEVLVGQSRILTVKEDLIAARNQPLIAVGDPTVIEFSVLGLRQIRITGLRLGVTDFSITTGSGQTFTYEVRVTTDLSLLEAQLRSLFPDTSIRLGQVRGNVVVEGEARSNAQVSQILETIKGYLGALPAGGAGPGGGLGGGVGRGGGGGLRMSSSAPRDSEVKPSALKTQAPGPDQPGDAGATPAQPGPDQAGGQFPSYVQPIGGLLGQPGIGAGAVVAQEPVSIMSAGFGSPLQVVGQPTTPGIVNLLRVPTSQQVMLKVRVAELNRTALRTIGANFLGVDRHTGAIVGSQIAGQATAGGGVGSIQGGVITGGRSLAGAAIENASGISTTTGGTTVFGIFQDADFQFLLNALRQNNVLKFLAEPNLVSMSGFPASFLAGGEFPVPVPQVSASGVAPTITVRFKEFGVRLGFLPIVVDEDVIRLTVAPEVSQIDFTIAVTLVAGGSPVPGLNTRRAQTTVELRQGQTLAIAGLLQLTLSGTTLRIPGLGDLPIIGPFFSNTTGSRVEKELVVLVTPYLVEGMNKDQVPPTPGDEVKEPNDLELYFLNRIEGRTGRDFRSTTRWDDVFGLRNHLNLEKKYVTGPVGFSD